MRVSAFTAAHGVIDDPTGRRLVDRPYWEVDDAGVIVRVAEGLPESDQRPPIVHDLGRVVVLPGLVNAHSHAFQRQIRGGTHRRGMGDPSDFWAWRREMYAAAERLDPASIFATSKACFAEMLRSGITTVGEFHYVHHRPDGRPYDDPNALSWAIRDAAREVGIRLVLIDTYYARAGVDESTPPKPRALEPAQRRFRDEDVDAYLGRIDALLDARDDTFAVALAAHSTRAVPFDDLRAIAEYATRHELVVHAHVSEQPRENDESQREYGRSPTRVLADAGLLARPRRFTAVHAIHVTPEDVDVLSDQHVCACPTTEADLGDGILPATDMLRRGVAFALGTDSNSIIDLVQEARLLEMGERLRRQARLCLVPSAHGHEGPGPTLLDAMTVGGASALGVRHEVRAEATSHAAAPATKPRLGARAFGVGALGVGAPFDAVTFDLCHPSLRDVPAAWLLDAITLAGSAAPVSQVFVGGRRRA
jgi:formimidoylglutamate deiminase